MWDLKSITKKFNLQNKHRFTDIENLINKRERREG